MEAVLLIHAILLNLAGYALLGAVFAGWFVTAGVGRLDESAKGGPWSFRLLIFPGCAALWPVLLVKLVRLVRGGQS